MKIIGLQKQSLMDYPGKMAAIIFTPGCNFRCAFCHNHDIAYGESISKFVDFNIIKPFFIERKNFLEAVVITGGEPTLQSDLIDVIKELKDLNYSVKLDTNGTNPDMLKKLISSRLIDYIAMDIKSDLNFQKYNNAVGNCIDLTTFNKILESIEIIMDSGLDYEFRTTLDPNVILLDDFKSIGEKIKGAKNYYLQQLNLDNVNNEEVLKSKKYSKKEIFKVIDKLKEKIKNVKARGFK